MSFEYSFGIGSINQVLGGKVNFVNSFKEVNTQESKTLIYIPKIIGIYQVDNEESLKELSKPIDSLIGQLGCIFKTGEEDNVFFNLIKLIYDPTIIKDSLINQVIKDPFKRLKLIRYDEFDEDFLYTKNPPKIHSLSQSLFKKNSESDFVVENIRDQFRIIRDDFGLTRLEAVQLYTAEKYVDNKKGLGPLLSNRSIIDDFNDFLKDEHEL